MVRYYEYTTHKDKWHYIAVKEWLDIKLHQMPPYHLFSKNVLPQFAGPTINTLQNLPLPCYSKSLIASANTKGFILFSWNTYLAHSCHSMSQPSTQLSDWHFLSISILVVFSRQMFSLRSLRGLLDLDNTKTAKSVCLSSFLWLLKEKAQCHDVYRFLIKLTDFVLSQTFPGCCFLFLFLWSICCGFLGI